VPYSDRKVVAVPTCDILQGGGSIYCTAD
jgi:agmatine/peptidylarginine deiminase